ncbi:glyoxylase-like metal-dependent hydrolase (beta-lactamase superfamily II) [Nocardia tenerifensis]|uniref:Glyoxylase-like metal-dependent hydrolase (Beta-lactamase superfamily II) n=1 Tax=Nocardia tenerifensis TaxID=228006 RepID=A0A318KBY9_9NOCA|nr:MBL fold metallo-hydrolase [Nocardia tenerifensis]PXX71636.1 glyoxylase-like metal-dependent hydrolase (beta-lactamase superfamily II) [Nocardia tenerifensis]
MTTEQWRVGNISITKIEETRGWTPLDFLLDIFPAATREDIERIEWLRPTYFDGENMNGMVHSLLVQTPTHRIVVDTGIGNGKQRISPVFDNLDTDFLERFEQVWRREEVDGVLATHLHIDHVGWNTIREDGRWRPTFPNARYYFVREEYEHWQSFARNPHAHETYSEFGYSMVDGAAVYEDSLAPVADLITWVEPGQTVVPGISLISTAGHTPGHVSILLEDEAESAVITGDLMHSQFQIAHPDWSVAMDTDTEAAADSRKAFLERFADTPTLILGTHFGTPTGGHIIRDGDAYKLVPEPAR